MKLLLCTVFAITLAACGGGQDNHQTWKDRMPTVDCTPRTPQAKAELKACPKLADYLHPTRAEQREIVGYLNRKNQIEGTIDFTQYFPPGCYTWTFDPTSDVPKGHPQHSAECHNNLQEKLRDFNIPGPPTTTKEKESEER
ncbi:MAG: hypothetical protein ABSG32_25700 [Terriglobia bacterium]|jgi:hypothetical protein